MEIAGSLEAINRLPTRARTMTDVESAWFGALIEGEGHISWGARTRALVVGSTCLETLEVLQRLSGVGSIITRKQHTGPITQRKPQWRWAMYGQRDVVHILSQISDYLTSKRELAKTIISENRHLLD